MWNKTSIRELCEITSSKRIFVADYQLEGVPFYRGREIIEEQRGSLDVSVELFISRDKFAEIKSKFGAPQTGELLLTSVGTLGIPYIVRAGEEFYFKDGNLTWFKNFQNLESWFLYYWLLSPQGKAELRKCTIGSSQSAFTIVLLKGIEIDLPPLPAQRRIAAILSAYDDLIENNSRRIKILEEMAQLLYREWFVHFRFPGHEGVKMVKGVPEGWEAKRVEEIAKVNASNVKKGEEPTEINYVDIASVSTGQINEITHLPFKSAPGRARRIVKHGDIIWSCVRPNRKSYSVILNPLCLT